VTEAQGDVHIGLCLVVAIWIAYFTLVMLVLPKALQIFGKQADATNSIIASSQDSNSAFSFISLNTFTSLPMLGTYIAALRLHLESAEHRHAKLKNKGGLGISSKSSPIQNNNSVNHSTALPQPSPSGSKLAHEISSRRSSSVTGAPAAAGTPKKVPGVVHTFSSRAQS
jgi:hypothetical protein